MEELENPTKYMESRCPAWCDRILLNNNFKDILNNSSTNIEYGMMGENICMGDHKVHLDFLLKRNKFKKKFFYLNQKPIYLYFNVKYPQEIFNDAANLANKLDNCISNNSRSNNNSSAINTRKQPLNFSYVNNTLVNLNEPSADIHDNALFNNINSLKHMIDFKTYARYYINNIKPPPFKETCLGSFKHVNSHTSSKPAVFSKSVNDFLVLNQWLKSIVELVVKTNSTKSSSRECSECFQNKLNETNCALLQHFDQNNLLKSCLVNFF